MANGIQEYNPLLRAWRALRIPQGNLFPAGPGGNPFFAESIGPGARVPQLEPPAVAPPAVSPPAVSPMTGGVGGAAEPRGAIVDHLAAARAALDTRTRPTADFTATKTEPGGDVSLAWRGGQLQRYDPSKGLGAAMTGLGPGALGGTSLAESRERGFMGESGALGGGGFGPSQTDWSKVANPLAFEAFRERPAMAEIERAAQDPLWRERELADIEQRQKIAVGASAIRLEDQIRRERETAREGQIETEAQRRIAIQNRQRTAAGKSPLTPEEEDQVFSQVRMRFGMGAF